MPGVLAESKLFDRFLGDRDLDKLQLAAFATFLIFIDSKLRASPARLNEYHRYQSIEMLQIQLTHPEVVNIFATSPHTNIGSAHYPDHIRGSYIQFLRFPDTW